MRGGGGAEGVARRYGLDISVLERLMDRPVYARRPERFPESGGYDPRFPARRRSLSRALLRRAARTRRAGAHRRAPCCALALWHIL